jgi:hypothetical protein
MKGLIILLSALVILAIYTVDFLQLSYRLHAWEAFGEMPVPAEEIRYFVPNTPNRISYTDPTSGTGVSCETTLAYVKIASGDTYRCCDAGGRIACLAGEYSNEIPLPDRACTDSLKRAFAVPDAVESAVDYQLYGSCAQGGPSQLTVVQMDDNGRILWKHMDVEDILFLIGTLRCVLAPLLLVLIIAIVVITGRAVPREPIPRLP